MTDTDGSVQSRIPLLAPRNARNTNESPTIRSSTPPDSDITERSSTTCSDSFACPSHSSRTSTGNHKTDNRCATRAQCNQRRSRDTSDLANGGTPNTTTRRETAAIPVHGDNHHRQSVPPQPQHYPRVNHNTSVLCNGPTVHNATFTRPLRTTYQRLTIDTRLPAYPRVEGNITSAPAYCGIPDSGSRLGRWV